MYAKVFHGQFCQRPFEDQLESCWSSYLCESLLKFCHLIKKCKYLMSVFFLKKNKIDKRIVSPSSLENTFLIVNNLPDNFGYQGNKDIRF